MIPYLTIRGAKEHNLKSLNLKIPRNKLIVITGLSGSGKSSLAFDTIYAEGQRRYVESLSAYARQFLRQMRKPDVESIDGLSPSISIQQRAGIFNPRSTVATTTEVYDYLRLLFARIGKVHCYKCGRGISRQSVDEIVAQLLSENNRRDSNFFLILAPVVRGRKGEYQQLLKEIQKQGFVRVMADGKLYDIEQEMVLDKNVKHNIEVVVDRLLIKEGIKKRLSDSVETALKLGKGMVIGVYGRMNKSDGQFAISRRISFGENYACLECGISYEEVEPRIFSFNSPYGACSSCNGLGMDIRMGSDAAFSEECLLCKGSRLKMESLAVTVKDKNIWDAARMSISEASRFFNGLRLENSEKVIAAPVLKEVQQRLKFMLNVGLGYLTLERSSSTLSGGEGRRIKLATQIGTRLSGVLYVLDEPSIGLHQRDNIKLLNALEELRDLGNTVLIVEHDEATIRRADYIIDLGPGAGELGGRVIAAGTLKDILKSKKSLTAKYLRREVQIKVPLRRRKSSAKNSIFIKGASEHNLKNIDVRIPLGVFTCITGVSGSGKSTLMDEILYRNIAKKFYNSRLKPGRCRAVSGLENIDKVVVIDQSPIGRTPRSNPATYTGVFSHIRELFSMLPDSKVRGYKPGRFSFNVKSGRCESCHGDGIKRIEMHFLPDVYVGCEVCKGKRFNDQTLQIRYKGVSISDVLAMSIEESNRLFENIPKIKHKLDTLISVGLGYIKLGQSALTLSGGEAQRVKLSAYLSVREAGRTLYILDEPTTGLHFADIHKLLEVLQRLIDAGNTVLVIEHNLDVIKSADYIIDLGPEGGDEGGKIVAKGTPEDIVKNPGSYTGRYLKKVLDRE